MKVFLNPGHAPNGTPDPGAIGPTGLREADVTAAVAIKTAAYLQAAGCQTLICQNDSLKQICEQANNWDPDIAVSIHCNGFANPQVNGVETLHFSSEQSIKLARYIQTQIVTASALSDRGIKYRPNLYVLRHILAPTVLVELAFITNPAAEELLGSANGRDLFARAIARGVTDYWQGGS